MSLQSEERRTQLPLEHLMGRVGLSQLIRLEAQSSLGQRNRRLWGQGGCWGQSRGLERQVSSKHLNGVEAGLVTWVPHKESAHRPEGHEWKSPGCTPSKSC